MTPITLTDEEREALKQNLMKRYAAADRLEPEARRRGNIAEWGDALTQFATAGSRGNLGLKADTAFFDKQRESADHDIAMARQDRAQALSDAKNLIGLGYGEEEMAQKRKEWERQPGQWERQDRASDYQLNKLRDEDTIRRDSMDPNSPSSYVKQELARRRSENQFLDSDGKARYPAVDFKNISGAELGGIDDLLKGGSSGPNTADLYFKQANLELARQGRDIQLANTQAARAQEQYHQRKDTLDREDRLKKEMSDKVIKYQNDSEPLKEQMDAISRVESTMGFPVEKYDKATESVDGRKIDLPGFNVPLLGRITAHDTNAKDLERDIGNIINKEIKSQAGTAVSSSEMERIRIAWGQGRYNTEAEMIGALAAYKDATRRALQRLEAGFETPVREKYQQNFQKTPGPVKPGTVGSGAVIIHPRRETLP